MVKFNLGEIVLVQLGGKTYEGMVYYRNREGSVDIIYEDPESPSILTRDVMGSYTILEPYIGKRYRATSSNDRWSSAVVTHATICLGGE